MAGTGRYYVLRAYGAGYDVYSWSKDLGRARAIATRLGWVVRAQNESEAIRLLLRQLKANKFEGNDHTVWRGV